MNHELPNFPLAPWELPPDSTEPLVTPATMRWHGTLFGRETDWLVRVVPFTKRAGEIFVRALDEGEPGNWWFGLIEIAMIRSLSLEQLRVQVEHRLSSTAFASQWRTMYLRDEHRIWAVRTHAEGNSDLQLLQGRDNKACFSIDYPFDFLQAPARQVHDEIRRVWNDQTTDLSFARRWLSSSLDEQLAVMLHWKRGGGKELRQAMQVVLRALGPTLSLLWLFRPESQTWFLAQRIDEDWWEPMDSASGLCAWVLAPGFIPPDINHWNTPKKIFFQKLNHGARRKN